LTCSIILKIEANRLAITVNANRYDSGEKIVVILIQMPPIYFASKASTALITSEVTSRIS